MSVLLLQGCSKSKNRPGDAVPALNLYSGYFFKIIKKAIREDEFDDRIDVCILSAEYGLIDADSEIRWYDRRMDANRAEEIAPSVQETLRAKVRDTYDTIIVNLGSVYDRTLDGIEESLTQDVYYIEGGGIGEKGHVLKRVVRGDIQAANDKPQVLSK